jgi:hypothetical protein
MNKKNIFIIVMMLLLLTSFFSVTTVAYDYHDCIPDWLKDFADGLNIENPCDPWGPCDDDDVDDDTGDDDSNGGNSDYVDPYAGSGRGSNNKESSVVLTPPNQNPVADASEGEPFEGFVDEIITFDGSNSYDPDGEIVEWFWDFGDGDTDLGSVVTHSYSELGVYSIEFKVIDDDGAEDWYETQIVISQPNRPPTKPIVRNLKSEFTVNKEYVFTMVSTDPDGDKVQYFVDWGDGTTVTSELMENGVLFSLTHKWTSDGDYTIKVTAIDENSASSEITELEVTIQKGVETGVLNFALVALLAIALVGVLVAFLEYKRRKNR